jgi:parvulin-like peptidyl-prolyl isomerase
MISNQLNKTDNKRKRVHKSHLLIDTTKKAKESFKRRKKTSRKFWKEKNKNKRGTYHWDEK